MAMDKYDMNDPTDVDIMRAEFDGYTADDWDDMIAAAESYSMKRKELGMLRTALRKAQMGKYLSVKQIYFILQVVERLEELQDEEEYEEEEE